MKVARGLIAPAVIALALVTVTGCGQSVDEMVLNPNTKEELINRLLTENIGKEQIMQRLTTDDEMLETIEQIDIDEIMQEVKRSSENITVVSSELISITQKINRGDGIFGKIFTDTTFTRNLDATTKNIAEITHTVVGDTKGTNFPCFTQLSKGLNNLFRWNFTVGPV